jgi:hypothetical protein
MIRCFLGNNGVEDVHLKVECNGMSALYGCAAPENPVLTTVLPENRRSAELSISQRDTKSYQLNVLVLTVG